MRRGRLRWVIAGGLLIALAVAAIVAWPHARRYTGAAPPVQFYQKVQLESSLDRDYERVLGVASNAGNNLGTLAKALRYGADVIESVFEEQVQSVRMEVSTGDRSPAAAARPPAATSTTRSRATNTARPASATCPRRAGSATGSGNRQSEGWTLEQASPGVVTWTTPADRRYTALPGKHPT